MTSPDDHAHGSERHMPDHKARLDLVDVSMSPRASRWISWVASATVVILAVVAAVLSYSGLRHLALIAGYEPWAAVMFPIVIDGLTLVGSLGVVYSTLAGLRVWYPWTLLSIGVIASVAGNVAASPNDDLVSRLVHAAPPVALALALEELLRVYRNRARRRAAEAALEEQARQKAAALEAEQAERAAEQARAEREEARKDEAARLQHEREEAAANRQHELEQQRIRTQATLAETERLEAQTRASQASTTRPTRPGEPEAAATRDRTAAHAPKQARLASGGPGQAEGEESKKDTIMRLLTENPDAPVRVIATQAGTSAGYVRNVKAKMDDAESASPAPEPREATQPSAEPASTQNDQAEPPTPAPETTPTAPSPDAATTEATRTGPELANHGPATTAAPEAEPAEHAPNQFDSDPFAVPTRAIPSRDRSLEPVH